MNTVETPKGGQYQVRLPDGTKVWLNAASALKYPASFASLKERRVELSGEAYFEVAHNKSMPLHVKTAMQDVEVLGTHFNINSYDNEPTTATTLLEGSVRIFSLKSHVSRMLVPGQQSVLSPGTISIVPIDTEQAVAWKNNQFIFESEDIHYIMRMIERWYNVKYSGKVPADKFGGSVSRFENVSEVLKALELTGKVHFKIEGRRIMVFR